MRLLLSAILLSFTCLPALADKVPPGFALQRVIILRSPAGRNRILAKVPLKIAKVLGGGKTFLVIKPSATTSRSAYDALLASLAKEPEVESVVPDTLVYAKDDDHDDSTTTKQKAPRSEAPVAKDKPMCRLYPRCGDRNPAWASLQVGADLAEVVVKSTTGDKKFFARLAVVDSGFDTKTQSSGIESKGLETFKGHDSSGDKDIDIDGHGTAVTGMIAGKEIGVTHHVTLDVYRVTEQNANGQVSSALLAAAIEKACQTSDVVNVSWGDLSEEVGARVLEKELWYKAAAEKGCLVVKAAGNSGIKANGTRAPVPLDAPFLKVAASDEFSDDAPFSSEGGIYGPGSGVFSLLSAQHFYDQETRKNSCVVGKNQVGPINGTSFAAPLVAGVAGQVITILRSRDVLPKDPKAKLKLVKSILSASAQWSKESGSRQPVVNALTAALMAKAVAAGPVPSVDELIALTRKDESVRKTCESPTEDCVAITDCELKKRCVSHLRFHFQACSPPLADKALGDLQRKLFDVYHQLDEGELMLQLIDRLPGKSPLAQEAAGELNRQWGSLMHPEYKFVFDLGKAPRAVNLLHTAKRSALSANFDVPAKLRTILQSSNIASLVRFQFPLNQTATQSAETQNAEKLFGILTSLDVPEQIRILEEIPDEYLANDAKPYDFLYYLDLHKDRLALKTKAAFESKMAQIASLWFSGNLQNKYTFSLNFLTPIQDTLMTYLKNGPEKMAALFKEPLRESKLQLYSFAVGSKTALGDQKMPLLSAMAQDPKMKEDAYFYLLYHALDALSEEGDADVMRTAVKKVLLENPRAGMPFFAIAPHPALVEDKHRALAEDGFFGKFIQLNLDRGIEKLGRADLTLPGAKLEIDNIVATIKANPLLAPEEGEAIFTGSKSLETFLKLAASNLIQVDEIKDYGSPQQIEASLQTCERTLELLRKFEEYGCTATLKTSLDELRKDILKRPEKYPQSMRQNIGKLYDIPETGPAR